MIKLLSVCGSPVEKSSTEIILMQIAKAIKINSAEKVRHTHIHLNDLNYIPCQACGETPEPEFCFFDDDLSNVYKNIVECDCFLFGSPIYFDSVTAQAKGFIDRINCFRPPDYNSELEKHPFKKRLHRKKPGGMVLVGGENAWFEGARRVAAALFKWIEIENCGLVTFASYDYNRSGTVFDSPQILREAERLGNLLAKKIDVKR